MLLTHVLLEGKVCRTSFWHRSIPTVPKYTGMWYKGLTKHLVCWIGYHTQHAYTVLGLYRYLSSTEMANLGWRKYLIKSEQLFWLDGIYMGLIHSIKLWINFKWYWEEFVFMFGYLSFIWGTCERMVTRSLSCNSRIS